MPQEEEAAERLRKIVDGFRDRYGRYGDGIVRDMGLLLCAVGRLDFMETTAERLATDKERPLDVRRTAREILGWKPGEHGGPD